MSTQEQYMHGQACRKKTFQLYMLNVSLEVKVKKTPSMKESQNDSKEP